MPYVDEGLVKKAVDVGAWESNYIPQKITYLCIGTPFTNMD